MTTNTAANKIGTAYHDGVQWVIDFSPNLTGTHGSWYHPSFRVLQKHAKKYGVKIVKRA